MNIEDVIQLLNNRLREFKLSRDYARMSGDLERMNVADKEILALEDTLYQLGLLVDTSKSAAVKEEILSEVITDGSVSVLGEYDITLYATDPLHEEKIMNILSAMGVMDTVEKIEGYIRGKYLSSPVTGEMVMSAALAYSVDARLMMAIMEQDSRFGTVGLAVGTLNPGNVGNDDDGNTRTYESWQEGVTAVAEWLSRHRGSTIVLETPEEAVLEPIATSTSAFILPSATSTSPTSTSTPITATSTTTTFITIPTGTTTPIIATSTPLTATSTSGSATSTPSFITPTTSTSTPSTVTITPATSTTTPTTGTSTPTTTTPANTSTSTTTPASTEEPSPDDSSQQSEEQGEQADSEAETAADTTAQDTTTPN